MGTEGVTCKCRAWQAWENTFGELRWVRIVDFEEGGQNAYCHDCHSELGFDSDGEPTVRAMVPEKETREEFPARARERAPLDFDALRMDISDEDMAALGELPERGEAMVPRADYDRLMAYARVVHM